jgi:hypothetical protein
MYLSLQYYHSCLNSPTDLPTAEPEAGIDSSTEKAIFIVGGSSWAFPRMIGLVTASS